MDVYGRLPGLALALLLFALAAPGGAEIYRWTDAEGRVHFTQDLQRVPPAQRSAAEDAAHAKPARSRVQIYTAPPAAQSAANPTLPAGAGGKAGAGSADVHRIRVQRAGSSMLVNVRIDGQLDVPFHIDTGASDVVLPSWAAEQLGLDLSNARTGVYSTANGLVTQKLVRLRSVSLGGASVSDVPATVSESMREGLLGLSYFNHFKYDIDPVAGVVTLRRNDLAESGVLRGGRSQQQWLQQFASARGRIAQTERERDALPFSRTRKRAELQQEVERLGREFSLLEAEADDAHVPFSWRD